MVRFPAGITCSFLLLSKASKSPLRPTKIPVKSVPGALSSRVMLPGCQADPSSTSSAEVKNQWSYTYTPHLGSWRAQGQPYSSLTNIAVNSVVLETLNLNLDIYNFQSRTIHFKSTTDSHCAVVGSIVGLRSVCAFCTINAHKSKHKIYTTQYIQEHGKHPKWQDPYLSGNLFVTAKCVSLSRQHSAPIPLGIHAERVRFGKNKCGSVMLLLTVTETVTWSVTIETETSESIFTLRVYQSGDPTTYFKRQ
jgi:hypothetical protein